MSLGLREQQKRDRRERIFQAAIRLFQRQGFEATTVLEIARQARVSRGTVFNYYPYKEAILIEHLSHFLQRVEKEVKVSSHTDTPLQSIQQMFEVLAQFAETNRDLVLPLSYELLNPDPERSRQAYLALPLVKMLQDYLAIARERGLVRQDFSLERLAHTLANAFFLTVLQWAAYRQNRSIVDELDKALKLVLEGVTLPGVFSPP